MKTHWLLTSLLVCSQLVAFPQRFSLKGRLTAYDTETKVALMKLNHLDLFFSGSNLSVVDTATIDGNGNFEFNNPAIIENNTFYRLNVTTGDQSPGGICMLGTNENFAFFLLNKHTQIEFTTDPDHVSQQLIITKGDKAAYLINRLSTTRKRYNEVVDEHVKRRKALDKSLPSYADSVKSINAHMKEGATTTNYYEDMMHFADTVSNPYISILATQYLPDDLPHSFFVNMNERYKKEIPGSKYTEQFTAQVTGGNTFLKEGSKAPEITLPDTKGQIIKLSGLKGKYVLIDFGASWCAPCRAENVSVIKPLYNKYRNKGFTVLSISQDMNRANWLSAIEKDETNTWYNVSDLKGQASKTAEDYRVLSLPCNYLVDPNGLIIARDLHDAKLEKFVEKILQ